MENILFSKIQGAVGDVGLVAQLTEDKTDVVFVENFEIMYI